MLAHVALTFRTTPSGRRDDPVDHSAMSSRQAHEYVRVITENHNNMATGIGSLQHITDDGDVSFIVTEDAVIYAVNCHPTPQIERA